MIKKESKTKDKTIKFPPALHKKIVKAAKKAKRKFHPFVILHLDETIK